jgi:hypothetical protein
MKVAYVVALLAIANNTLAQEASTHMLTFTNKGCIFQLETLNANDDQVLIEHMSAVQNLILKNDLPRNLWDDEEVPKAYEVIWDTLRSSIRLKMTLWEIGIHQQDSNVITWRTNGTVSANSATIHCSNEEERQRVSDTVRSLFGGCSSTKQPPTVTVSFNPVWTPHAIPDVASAVTNSPSPPPLTSPPPQITNQLAKASLNLMRVNLEEMERWPNPTAEQVEQIRYQHKLLKAYEDLFQAFDAMK